MDSHNELPAQATLKVGLIVPGPNHRTYYDPRKMAELRDGLRAANGVRQPIQVRPHPTEDGRWEIIAGERRWRCAKEVYGDDYDMPVVITEATDAEVRALGIVENYYRDDPSDIEQARGAANLLQFCKNDRHEVAAQLGWTLDLLERRLLLLSCSKVVQDALVERRIKLGHAELLAGLEQGRQDQVLARILEHAVTVEALRAQLGQYAKRLVDACFDTTQCAGCPHNSARQAALFDESLGDGFCQHPTHFEALTLAAIEAKAEPLKGRFQTVRIVKAGDGFLPLVVAPGGALGVGAQQHAECQTCANFGCSISAVPGSIGDVSESLCFDAACHSRHVAARRKADKARGATATPAQAATPWTQQAAKTASTGGSLSLPPRVVEYRRALWKKWAANALMGDSQRNPRILVSFALGGALRRMDQDRFNGVSRHLLGTSAAGANIAQALSAIDQAEPAGVGRALHAIGASVVYALTDPELVLVLDYLEVDERRHYTLDREYMDMLTVAHLDGLAKEVGLVAAMGAKAYAKARTLKRGELIDALLAVNGFAYAGAVPKAIRYDRRGMRKRQAGERVAVKPGAAVAAEPAEAPTASTPEAVGDAEPGVAADPAEPAAVESVESVESIDLGESGCEPLCMSQQHIEMA
ncbi:MAG TPA: PRTRC system ParB family protein [Burkholderiaceae bacterium]|nr:PRTRC system ParB family protein [Burkholderiaceae bacterium]